MKLSGLEIQILFVNIIQYGPDKFIFIIPEESRGIPGQFH